ncbi:MAG: hypothetical protein ACOCUI_05415 [bacterium]
MDLKMIIKKANNFIKEHKPIQKNWYDEIFIDFEDIFPNNMTVDIVYESDIDKRRWYELRDVVFRLELNDEQNFGVVEYEYVKTTLITQLYSEMASISDIYHEYPEFKIVQPREITTIIYE